MKPIIFLLPLLFAAGVAQAQQPAAGHDSTVVKVERIVIKPAPNPMITANDSAREQARLANAQYLRETANTTPKPVKVVQPAPGGLAQPGESLKPTEQIGAEEAANRARIRHAQEQQMIQDALKHKKPVKKAAKLNAAIRAADEPETKDLKPAKKKKK